MDIPSLLKGYSYLVIMELCENTARAGSTVIVGVVVSQIHAVLTHLAWGIGHAAEQVTIRL